MGDKVTGRQPDGLGILVVADSLRDNGGLRVALEYVRQWGAAGASASLAVAQDVDDVALAQVEPSLPVVCLTRLNSRFRYTWPLALGRLAARARRADVMVAGSETGIGLLLTFVAARVARRPFAVLVQADLDDAIATWTPRPLQPPTRWVHRHADAAVCVAESIVPGVVANGLPADRVTVVVNGIDVAAVRTRAGLPPVPDAADRPVEPRRDSELPTVLGVGRLSVQKDFPLLVRAHAAVLAAGVEHRLMIVGEGPTRDQITDVVRELGVADSVELLGYRENPHALMSSADLFVLSSRTEGMPLTVLEALAVGAPIVATRCGAGVDLLLDGGRFGDLVPPGSVEAMASAIEQNLRDPARLSARAAAGPCRALAFDVAQSARQILAILTGLARSDESLRSSSVS